MAWQWHRPRGGSDHPSQVPETGPLWKNRVVHRHHHGGDLPRLRLSLEENGGGTGQPMAVTSQCTAAPMAVYTGVSDDHLKLAALGPSLPSPGGHCPRGDSAIEQGVAVPPRHLH
jgi:hypothetical protein